MTKALDKVGWGRAAQAPVFALRFKRGWGKKSRSVRSLTPNDCCTAVRCRSRCLQGVVVQFRVVDGEVRKGDLIKFMNTGCEYDITELGVLAPKPIEVCGAGRGQSVSECWLEGLQGMWALAARPVVVGGGGACCRGGWCL